MKIIYLTNSRMPTEKAHGLQIAKMCEAFSNQGVDLELFIPRRRNFIKENIFVYYFLKTQFKVSKLFTFDIINIFNNRVGFFVQNISFAFSVVFCLLKRNYRGVIYARDYLSLFLLSFFPRFFLFYEMHSFPNKLNFFYRRLFRKVKFVVISHGLQQELLARGVKEANIIVAPDGVDLDLFVKVSNDKLKLRDLLDLPKEKKIVAYIGKLTTMGEAKGVEFLWAAFRKVLDKIHGAFLLLVGPNQEEIESIEKTLKSFGLQKDNYCLVAHVNQRRVVEYAKAVDALIMAYPDKKHYRLYMSPLKMFEYMASGVPIVATDLPTTRAILNEGAFLVAPDNLESLAGGIIEALTNTTLADKLAQQALKDVKNYTWSKRGEKILDFIKNAAE